MKQVILWSALLLAGLPRASAQHTAFRWVIGEVDKVYTHPAFGNYCMGAGVDRSFNDRLTIGFDVSYDLGNAFRSFGQDVQFHYGGIDYDYAVKLRLLNLNYHTEFALADNDATHVYIGTYIGVRSIGQTWELESAYAGNNGGSYNGSRGSTQTGSKVLVPIGLRLGVRGAVDAGFMDLYLGLGYQIGGGGQVMDAARYHAAPEFMDTSSLALTIGWAYGIGW